MEEQQPNKKQKLSNNTAASIATSQEVDVLASPTATSFDLTIWSPPTSDPNSTKNSTSISSTDKANDSATLTSNSTTAASSTSSYATSATSATSTASTASTTSTISTSTSSATVTSPTISPLSPTFSSHQGIIDFQKNLHEQQSRKNIELTIKKEDEAKQLLDETHVRASSVASPPTEHVVSPPTEHIVSPPTEHIVSPSTEHIVSPPTEHIVSPPVEHITSPPSVSSPTQSPSVRSPLQSIQHQPTPPQPPQPPQLSPKGQPPQLSPKGQPPQLSPKGQPHQPSLQPQSQNKNSSDTLRVSVTDVPTSFKIDNLIRFHVSSDTHSEQQGTLDNPQKIRKIEQHQLPPNTISPLSLLVHREKEKITTSLKLFMRIERGHLEDVYACNPFTQDPEGPRDQD
jgi:hypothetical protein